MGIEHWIGSNTWVKDTASVLLGQWVHYAAVYDHGGAGMKFYVNGQLVNTNPLNTLGPAQLTGTLAMTIGAANKSGDQRY